jgi:hypothetical protein
MSRQIPILFTDPMVLAILAGTKTQTRRPLTNKPVPEVGDVLYVREGWMAEGYHCFGCDDACDCGAALIRYRADGARLGKVYDTARKGLKMVDHPGCVDKVPQWDTGFRSAMEHPKWAARLHLRVVNVGTQPLEQINEADALAEGFRDRAAFLRTYRAIYPKEYNPTVRVIVFERTR